MLRALLAALKPKPESPEEEYSRLYFAFVKQGRRAGMTDEMIQHELQMRVAFVRLRRTISERAAKQPHKYWDIRREVAEAEGRLLGASTSRRVGIEFVKFVFESAPADILLPEAHAVCVEAWAKDSMPTTKIDPDYLTALR